MKILLFISLLTAYLTDDMSVWKQHIDTVIDLPYEYGYCAAIMAKDKEAAKPYVLRFREHVEAQRDSLPVGHYEMYMSAVSVYELRLHIAFHPTRSLRLARKAVQLAPDDPVTVSYCGTALFYAPAPFGNKKEALELFLRAEELFRDPLWYDCWLRPATMLYIAQCYEKKGDMSQALHWAQETLAEYPDFTFLRTWLEEHTNEQ